MTNHVFGNGAFCHVVSQESEFGLDAWRTPSGILFRHPPDQARTSGPIIGRPGRCVLDFQRQ